MNTRALELTGHLYQDEIGLVRDLCSAPVRELGAQIQETLDYRREVNIWEIFELKRVIFETERKILVKYLARVWISGNPQSRKTPKLSGW